MNDNIRVPCQGPARVTSGRGECGLAKRGGQEECCDVLAGPLGAATSEHIVRVRQHACVHILAI